MWSTKNRVARKNADYLNLTLKPIKSYIKQGMYINKIIDGKIESLFLKILQK